MRGLTEFFNNTAVQKAACYGAAVIGALGMASSFYLVSQDVSAGVAVLPPSCGAFMFGVIGANALRRNEPK